MDNSLECRPVMLPSGDEGYHDSPSIWCSNGYRLIYQDKFMSAARAAFGYKAQHLYLVSDREIKEGDLVPDGNIIKRVNKAMSVTNDGRWKKIEATTDKSLNLPPIPQSFIQEWVDKQGRIDSVKIKMYNQLYITAPHNPILNNEGEVIILPIKDSWNREEVMDFMAMAIMNNKSSMPMNIKELKREFPNQFNQHLDNMKGWFDKNY